MQMKTGVFLYTVSVHPDSCIIVVGVERIPLSGQAIPVSVLLFGVLAVWPDRWNCNRASGYMARRGYAVLRLVWWLNLVKDFTQNIIFLCLCVCCVLCVWCAMTQETHKTQVKT